MKSCRAKRDGSVESLGVCRIWMFMRLRCVEQLIKVGLLPIGRIKLGLKACDFVFLVWLRCLAVRLSAMSGSLA